MSDLIIFLVFYILIVFSVVGYGNFFVHFLKDSNIINCFGIQGLIGVSFLTILSYSTNIFFAHGYLHNTIVLVLGIIFFILNFLDKREIVSKNIVITSLFFLILFIGLLMHKNHDDFFYYHFPYTLSLVESNKIIGIGHLNHGFRTPSSIFYLNSLFYLPIINYFVINIGAILYMGFANIFLINRISKFLKIKNIFLLFLSTLSFLYINTAFYRISEHGTDRSALILIFLLIIVMLESINIKNIKDNLNELKKYYNEIIILLFLIISLKIFYFIYLVLFLAWIIYFINTAKLKDIFYILLNNPITYFLIYGIFLVLINVFLNTGCIIYPASFTCFENLNWGIDVEQVKDMKIWYEQWSKAGAGPNFRVDDVSLYLTNFNWISGWVERYFFTKVTDALFVIILISIILLTVFSKKKNNKSTQSIKYKIFYVVIISLFLEWFFNHPALRYGGFTVVALIFFIPTSIYLSRYDYERSFLKKRIYSLIILSLFVFVFKNINRINNEYNKYEYNPLKNPYFFLDQNAFMISNKIIKLQKINDNKYLIISRYDR
jgi:hypothetical protein